mmetsp:Transcript_12429/g.17745  ORF Transcript_12429/g.17745 Transcript_12429/m.17745 type:complete len:89 (+) Transcript_12429:4455-4721(+)
MLCLNSTKLLNTYKGKKMIQSLQIFSNQSRSNYLGEKSFHIHFCFKCMIVKACLRRFLRNHMKCSKKIHTKFFHYFKKSTNSSLIFDR